MEDLGMRKEVRFKLDVPALFYWDVPDETLLQGEGVTRDISVLGAFIVSSICPPIDAPLRFEAILPSLPGAIPLVRVKGEARVVRVVRGGDGKGENGFAVLSLSGKRWSLAVADCQPVGAVPVATGYQLLKAKAS